MRSSLHHQAHTPALFRLSLDSQQEKRGCPLQPSFHRTSSQLKPLLDLSMCFVPLAGISFLFLSLSSTSLSSVNGHPLQFKQICRTVVHLVHFLSSSFDLCSYFHNIFVFSGLPNLIPRNSQFCLCKSLCGMLLCLAFPLFIFCFLENEINIRNTR